MMPELGNFLLCLAAGLALLLSVYPLWGAARQDRRLMALARAAGLWAIRLYRRRLPAAGARLCGQ
ncbi:cytochrome c heme lyase subunit CcmF [Klebsiella pneumoniae]|nr:cytochrome c heme lyase subunit CcmF [Klebsiella pneumoniae]